MQPGENPLLLQDALTEASFGQRADSGVCGRGLRAGAGAGFETGARCAGFGGRLSSEPGAVLIVVGQAVRAQSKESGFCCVDQEVRSQFKGIRRFLLFKMSTFSWCGTYLLTHYLEGH